MTLAGSEEGVTSLAAAGAWYHAWHQGHGEPVTVHDPDEAAACNLLARELLKLDGSLRGTPVDAGGREWMVGDRVLVAHGDGGEVDADGAPIPAVGVPGTVEAVDAENGSFVVDFPIHGWNRFTAATPAVAVLDYAYAEVAADAGAPLVDLRLLDLSPEPVAPRGLEVEL